MDETEKKTEDSRDTARLEAFSDGVFSIAITLLVLNLHVPQRAELAHGNLLEPLRRQWPVYLSYLLSFMIIGIIWVNHHQMFKFIRRTNQPLLMLNSVLLFCVVTIPFSTDLLSEYITGTHSQQQIAAVIYNATFLALSVSYSVLWRYVVKRPVLMIVVEPRVIAAITRQRDATVGLYVLGCVLAYFSLPLSLALSIGMTIFYAFPRPGEAN